MQFFFYKTFLCGSKMNWTAQFFSYTKKTLATFLSIEYTTFVKWKFLILVSYTTEAMTWQVRPLESMASDDYLNRHVDAPVSEKEIYVHLLLLFLSFPVLFHCVQEMSQSSMVADNLRLWSFTVLHVEFQVFETVISSEFV